MKNIHKAVKNKEDGTFLNLFVIPNSNTTLFPSGYNKWRNKIEIKVSSKAKDNKANKEVITTIATFFNKSIKDIFIVSGKKSKIKTVLVKDISIDDAAEKLSESLDGL